MAERNAGVPVDKRIAFRVGLHQGDIFGDGGNLAAHLEGVAGPGGICVSYLTCPMPIPRTTRIVNGLRKSRLEIPIRAGDGCSDRCASLLQVGWSGW